MILRALPLRQADQHCAGYILLQIRDGFGTPWPSIDNNEDLAERLAEQLDSNAPVFESVEEFLDANSETEPPCN